MLRSGRLDFRADGCSVRGQALQPGLRSGPASNKRIHILFEVQPDARICRFQITEVDVIVVGVIVVGVAVISKRFQDFRGGLAGRYGLVGGPCLYISLSSERRSF